MTYEEFFADPDSATRQLIKAFNIAAVLCLTRVDASRWPNAIDKLDVVALATVLETISFPGDPWKVALIERYRPEIECMIWTAAHLTKDVIQAPVFDLNTDGKDEGYLRGAIASDILDHTLKGNYGMKVDNDTWDTWEARSVLVMTATNLATGLISIAKEWFNTGCDCRNHEHHYRNDDQPIGQTLPASLSDAPDETQLAADVILFDMRRRNRLH